MLHYRSIGSGPPVLILPGLLGTVETEWQAFLQPIADMGYTVIAADLPGHGESEMPKALTLRIIAEEIEKLLQEIKAEPVVILGYSLGGYAGLSWALKHPNRVIGVWMHSTKFYWSGEEAENLGTELDAAYLEENLPERLQVLRERHGEEKLATMLPWLQKLVTGLPDLGLTQLDLEDAKFPVMVSVGDRDELVPVNEAVDLYRALPQGQLCVLSDTNHPLSSVRDHVFLPIVRDFLNRLG
jgi:pimeloyl-ACP methyl ester carboxylesterase